MGRYVYTKINDVLTVVYDKEFSKTLLLYDEVSEDLFKEYENSTQKAHIKRVNVTTFVINITQECNLRCKYCSRYYGDYSSEYMNATVLLYTINWIIQYSKIIDEKCVIQFHGGEPTIRINVIEEVLEKIDLDELGRYIDLRIQTNGTTITNDLLSFCNKYNIHIGLSIDGPAEVTNSMRRFQNGEGISQKLSYGINLLNNAMQHKTISCLCVITKNSIGKANEIFEYIVSNGIDDLSILPLYNDFSCINDDKAIIPRNDEMADFSKAIIDLWIEKLLQGHEICMPNFQIWIWNLLSLNSDVVFKCNSCCGAGESMLFIDLNGDIYPCGPFSFYKETKVANILDLNVNFSTNDVIDMLQPLANRSVDECNDCGLQGICKSGCAANSYLHYKNYNKIDPYCDYWKAVISHLLIKISENPHLLEKIPDYSIRI